MGVTIASIGQFFEDASNERAKFYPDGVPGYEEIGDTSGGGSCMVLPLASLVGTVFQISSPFRISFSKNGSFYDTDLGVEPDFPIVNEVFLYDRPALTEYINNLK